MPTFHLVHSGDFRKQLQHLRGRYTDMPTVWAAVELSLRTNPFAHGLDAENHGVALTKQFGDVPPLRIAFRVATNTVTLLAIERRPE